VTRWLLLALGQHIFSKCVLLLSYWGCSVHVLLGGRLMQPQICLLEKQMEADLWKYIGLFPQIQDVPVLCLLGNQVAVCVNVSLEDNMATLQG
jgi:hypothetical protein